jgi:hypothetical protein
LNFVCLFNWGIDLLLPFKRQNRYLDVIAPQKTVPIDPIEFFMTLAVATWVTRKGPTKSLVEMMQFSCSDSEMDDFMGAIADRYKGEPRKQETFMLRWMAWSSFWMSGDLQSTFADYNRSELARCSIEVAARFPLTETCEFEYGPYLVAVADYLRVPSNRAWSGVPAHILDAPIAFCT